MKKTLLALSLSTLALAACSKTNQNTTDSTSASQTAEVTASQVVETVASQVTETAASAVEAIKPSVEGNAQASLDWNGSYKGILPCASCEGIETKLTLNADKTYELSQTYLGKGDAKAIITKGKFSFDKTGNIAVLDEAAEKSQYFVSENHIIALDQDGNIIQGNLAKNYELQKQSH